jgi:Fic family protein
MALFATAKEPFLRGFLKLENGVLSRLLDGFEGKLTTSKWAKLTKSSQDTAARDIARFIEQGILIRNPGGGRSTSYSLTAIQRDTCAK